MLYHNSINGMCIMCQIQDPYPRSQTTKNEEMPCNILTLSRLTYSELLYIINTSSDVKFLQACIHEFRQRLQDYNAWQIEEEERTARNDNAETSRPVQNELAVRSASEYDFTKWTYSELRDAINTTSDVERLQVLRHELLCRIGACNSWMSENGERISKDENVEMQSQTTTNQEANVSGSKPDLSRWNYFELRSTIESSCDTKLIETCRQELLCRLRVYNSWICNSGEQIIKEENLKTSETVKNKQEALSKSQYDLSRWKYTELRDTINTSCDIDLLEACRHEFHRRLKVYRAWEAKNRKRSALDDNARAPRSIMDAEVKAPEISPKQSILYDENTQCYFRIPFVGAQTLSPSDQTSKLGKDDMLMCELSLAETGLTRKRGADILEKDLS